VNWAVRIFLIIALGVSGYANSYAQSNVQFSGQAIQSLPGGRLRKAQLFVGDNQVRLEYRRGELDMVEIYDMNNHHTLLLVPQQKVYMQRAFLPGQVVNPMLPPRDSNPCTVMPEGECKKLGSETLYGRPVSKWEVTVKRQGKMLRSLHWIDDDRLMSLRDVWPDGSVSELKLQDIEEFDGRTSERWQRTTVRPDGKNETTTQWYDPELRITVREELPGGFIREIRHIRVAKQPATLFQVPEDYLCVEDRAETQE
jgi:hypothetical protein